MLQRVVCDGSEERAYQMESDDIDSLLAAVAAVAAAMREDRCVLRCLVRRLLCKALSLGKRKNI